MGTTPGRPSEGWGTLQRGGAPFRGATAREAARQARYKQGTDHNAQCMHHAFQAAFRTHHARGGTSAPSARRGLVSPSPNNACRPSSSTSSSACLPTSPACRPALPPRASVVAIARHPAGLRASPVQDSCCPLLTAADAAPETSEGGLLAGCSMELRCSPLLTAAAAASAITWGGWGRSPPQGRMGLLPPAGAGGAAPPHRLLTMPVARLLPICPSQGRAACGGRPASCCGLLRARW